MMIRAGSDRVPSQLLVLLAGLFVVGCSGRGEGANASSALTIRALSTHPEHISGNMPGTREGSNRYA